MKKKPKISNKALAKVEFEPTLHDNDEKPNSIKKLKEMIHENKKPSQYEVEKQAREEAARLAKIMHQHTHDSLNADAEAKKKAAQDKIKTEYDSLVTKFNAHRAANDHTKMIEMRYHFDPHYKAMQKDLEKESDKVKWKSKSEDRERGAKDFIEKYPHFVPHLALHYEHSQLDDEGIASLVPGVKSPSSIKSFRSKYQSSPVHKLAHEVMMDRTKKARIQYDSGARYAVRKYDDSEGHEFGGVKYTKKMDAAKAQTIGILTDRAKRISKKPSLLQKVKNLFKRNVN